MATVIAEPEAVGEVTDPQIEAVPVNETEQPQNEEPQPAADPIPPPTPAELRALHYQEVIAMGERVQEARNVWESLKKETGDAKKEFDGKTVELLRLMRRDPLQRQLLIEPHPEFESHDSPGESHQQDEEWRSVPLDSLFDPKKTTCKALAEAGIRTVGELTDYTGADKRLTDLPGIGPGKEQEIEDTMMNFWADNKDAQK